MKRNVLRLGSSHRALMPGLLLASCAALGQAQAACTPDSPVSNTTVTCTGTTTGGAIGYGTAGDTGNTYSVVSGANAVVIGQNRRSLHQAQGQHRRRRGRRELRLPVMSDHSHTGTARGGLRVGF